EAPGSRQRDEGRGAVRSDLPSPFLTGGAGGSLTQHGDGSSAARPPSAVTSLTLLAESLPYPHGNSSYPRPGSFHPRRHRGGPHRHRRSEILAAVDIAQASTARGEGYRNHPGI